MNVKYECLLCDRLFASNAARDKHVKAAHKEIHSVGTKKMFIDHAKIADAITASYAKKEPMLHEAQKLIEGARQTDYGDKLNNMSQIAMLMHGILAPKMQINCVITPEDVAMLMICVKMARLTASPDHADSLIDIAGYAGVYSLLQEERKAGKKNKGAVWDSREEL